MDKAMAIDLGGTFIKYGVVNSKGDILYENKVPTPAEERDKVIEALIECIKEASAKHDVSCIGLGSPGLIDVDTGYIVGGAPQIQGWDDFPLAKIVEEKTGLSVYVDNDANLMGLGEYRFGNNKGLKNLVFLTIGTGIGAALIINGELYRGGFFAGGEVGYMPFKKGDELGYWEDFGSTKAMVENYLESQAKGKDRVDVNGEFILAKVSEGEERATNAFIEHIDVLGQGIAVLVSVLNPEKIVIGGGISEAGNFYIDSITERVKQYAAEECYGSLQIEAAALGNKAGFLGAGYYALSRGAAKC
jgi:glucokinase